MRYYNFNSQVREIYGGKFEFINYHLFDSIIKINIILVDSDKEAETETLCQFWFMILELFYMNIA